MKILYLGPENHEVIVYLKSFGDEIITTKEPLENESDILKNVDFIISFGYRHILRNAIIKKFQNRILNLHISYLPWNRGADPNLWSFLENTPKGVTIHYIDENVDTGDIIAQQEVVFSDEETLKTSYERLIITIINLFKKVWPQIRSGNLQAYSQPKSGSFHKISDRKPFEYLLTNGWDTPVINLIGKALEVRVHNEN